MSAIDNAERGRRNRTRGAVAERMVVNFMRSNGFPDARRYLAGDGRQPGDIDAHPLLCIEVRDRASSSWPSWCRQAVAEAREGMVPVVVRRTRGTPDVGLWECRWPEWAAIGDGPLVSAMPARYRSLVGTAEEPTRRRGDWWMGETFGSFVERVALIDAPPLVREGEGR